MRYWGSSVISHKIRKHAILWFWCNISDSGYQISWFSWYISWKLWLWDILISGKYFIFYQNAIHCTQFNYWNWTAVQSSASFERFWSCLKKNSWILQSVRILVTLRESFHHTTSHSVTRRLISVPRLASDFHLESEVDSQLGGSTERKLNPR